MSFGKMGSDITKSQSAIELRDDEFSSIMVPIKYGKNVFRNAKKYLSFLLTSLLTLLAVCLISTTVIY
jgi:magnesium-transporting ATPase (P-type)